MNSEQLVGLASKIAFGEGAHFPDNYKLSVFNQQLDDIQKAYNITGAGRKVLVVGGGGYVGTIICKSLIDHGYGVRCLDNYIYRHFQSSYSLLSTPGFEIIAGDLCDKEVVNDSLDGITDVFVLAGLVGDPITKKYPELSQEINLEGLSQFIKLLENRNNILRVIFISTCSNYGLIEGDELANEETVLKPLSLYAKAKVEIEREVLSLKGKVGFAVSVLRFATAFGLSPRMRFDLTVNEFAADLALGRELLVYDADTWRPYCHVHDFAVLLRRVLEAPRELVNFEVFNAGGDENNCTKRMLVELILNYVPDGKVKFKEHGTDPRNYRVDFQKVRSRLHFSPSYSIDDGVREVVNAVRNGFFHENLRQNLYGNYEII